MSDLDSSSATPATPIVESGPLSNSDTTANDFENVLAAALAERDKQLDAWETVYAGLPGWEQPKQLWVDQYQAAQATRLDARIWPLNYNKGTLIIPPDAGLPVVSGSPIIESGPSVDGTGPFAPISQLMSEAGPTAFGMASCPFGVEPERRFADGHSLERGHAGAARQYAAAMPTFGGVDLGGPVVEGTSAMGLATIAASNGHHS